MPAGAGERWFDDDDPAGLARRVERVIAAVQARQGAPCRSCGRVTCGHEAIFALVASGDDEAICAACLARDAERDEADARRELGVFVQGKACLAQGWRYANLREGYAAGAAPACIFPENGGGPTGTAAAGAPEAAAPAGPPAADAAWDAGDQGCGELVLELRRRVAALPPAAVLALRATDPGAREDLPAWCRLTGHALAWSRHPHYYIRKKESP